MVYNFSPHKFLIILIIFPLTVLAQRGNIKGKVMESGSPIPGVNILIMDTKYGGVSAPDGNYRISAIPAGTYSVRFSAVGYETQFFDIEIEPRRTSELNVEMKMKVIEVEEVKVFDSEVQRQDDPRTSLIDLKPAQARVLPGAVTDVFRTLQSLPGVLAPNDFSSQLIVRGSGPDQNLIVMDDIEVFNPYRLYGVISMFNPEAVSKVNLITGGFPANYGDRLSAVLDVTNKEGSTAKPVSGNINASIVSANIVLEGRNPFGIPGSWIINTRRTYYDLIIEPFVKNSGLVDENVSFPNFYDVQAKLAFGPFNHHKFYLNGIYSRDGVDLISGPNRSTPDSIGVANVTRNDLAGFAWHYAPNKDFLNKFIISWYRNKGDSQFDSEFLDPSLNRNNFENTVPDTLAPYLLNFDFNSTFGYKKYSIDDKLVYFWGQNEFETGAGIDFMDTRLDIDFKLDPQLRAIINSNPNFRLVLDDVKDEKNYWRTRAYVNNKFRISDKLYIQPGLRFDYYQILEKPYLAPRISFAYSLNDLTTVRAVWGIYYQSPGYEKLRDANVLYDLNQEITSKLNAEKATHYILSFERWLGAEWKAKVEGYYKHFNNLIVQDVVNGTDYFTERIPGTDPRFPEGWTRPVTNPSDSLTQIPTNNSNGKSYGVEFLLEKRNIVGQNRFSGWVSYAFAYANRFEDRRTIPFRFDQRHTFNLVLNYQASSWFDIGIRFQYGSGFPITTAIGIKPRIILEDNDGDFIPETPVIATRTNTAGKEEVIYNVDFGDRFNRLQSRKPAFQRLDVRFNFYADYWDLDWTFYLDVINVYNHSNVLNYDYYVSENLTLGREPTTMFPILPTFGFNVKF